MHFRRCCYSLGLEGFTIARISNTGFSVALTIVDGPYFIAYNILILLLILKHRIGRYMDAMFSGR